MTWIKKNQFKIMFWLMMGTVLVILIGAFFKVVLLALLVIPLLWLMFCLAYGE